MSEDQSKITVRDLGLASALTTAGFEIETIHKSIEGRSVFIFHKSVAIEETIKGYYADTLHIKARKFFDNTKMLKSRIYANN